MKIIFLFLLAFTNIYAARGIACEDSIEAGNWKKRICWDTECFQQKFDHGLSDSEICEVSVTRNVSEYARSECFTFGINDDQVINDQIIIDVSHKQFGCEETAINVTFAQTESDIWESSRVHTYAASKNPPYGHISFGQWNQPASSWTPAIKWGQRPELQGYYLISEDQTQIITFPFHGTEENTMCGFQMIVSHDDMSRVRFSYGMFFLEEDRLSTQRLTFGSFCVVR